MYDEGDGIMRALGEYLIGVAAAAILCGVVNSIAPRQGMMAQTMKLLLGLLMVLSVLRPWVDISMEDLFGWMDQITIEGEQVVTDGAAAGDQAYREVIIQRVEAYILEEAKGLGADIQVQVELSGEQLPTPIRARVSGALSPYAKEKLTQLLTDELGISREEIQWN